MEQYLTIPEAARMAQVTENLLNELVLSGRIRATMLATSGITLVNKDDALQLLPRDQRPEYQKHAHLSGTCIGIREASVKYSIPHQTISRWVEKGYIQIIQREGRKVLIDEADIAYCAEVYKANPGQGKWLFTQNGNPYTKKG